MQISHEDLTSSKENISKNNKKAAKKRISLN